MPPNKSPLRYPGGKTRACGKLTEILEQQFDMTQYTTIASPFFGGGSFEFHLQGRFKKHLLVNDKFSPLYRFWKQVKDDKVALCGAIRGILGKGVTKDDFTKFRETIMSAELSQLDAATLYFVINRCSFSGATLSGGFSEEASKKRFTESSVKRISELDLAGVAVVNKDFVDFLDIVHADAFIFLDPPYYLETSNLYGNNGDMHESFDHRALFSVISEKKNWMMTYNNCPYIRDLYKDYMIIETSWSYGMNASKESSEIVILCKKNI